MKMDLAAKNLSACVFIFQCLGHFYFSFKNLKKQNRDRWPNLRHTFYFIFLVLFLSSSMMLYTIVRKSNDYARSLTAKTLLNLILVDTAFVGWVLEIFVGVVEAYWATPLSKKFILTCVEIAEKFQRDFQHFIDYKAIRHKLMWQSLILVTYFVVTISFQYFFSKFYLKDDSLKLNYLFVICPLIFSTSLVLKFIFHVRLINTHLEAVCKVVGEVFPKFSFTGVVNGVFVKPVNAKSYRATTFKLKAISKIYSTIAKNAELVNRSMGLTLITVTAIQVVSIISGTYRVLMSTLGKNPENIIGKPFFNKI